MMILAGDERLPCLSKAKAEQHPRLVESEEKIHRQLVATRRWNRAL